MRRFLPITLFLMAICAPPVLAETPAAETPAAETPAAELPPHGLTAEQPAKGSYRIQGWIELPTRAEALLAVLADVGQQCALETCRFKVPGVTRTDILPGGTADAFETWSYVDDVLDGAYFAHLAIERAPPVLTLRVTTPDAAAIARLSDDTRRHEPFFHEQTTTWTLTERAADDGSFVSTRVEVTIAMASDRWMINLMPGQILSRTQDHVRLLFGYLAAVAPPEAPATPEMPTPEVTPEVPAIPEVPATPETQETPPS
jgi:hypothetical protein